jgi:hypothetical protein
MRFGKVLQVLALEELSLTFIMNFFEVHITKLDNKFNKPIKNITNEMRNTVTYIIDPLIADQYLFAYFCKTKTAI